jgi:hypothetical protein
MKGNWRRVLACAVLVLLSAGTTQLLLSADKERKPKVTVPVEAIGSDVTLIGRLGEPLATMMEVKGTWNRPDGNVKDNSPRFTVTHVNGKQLDAPVVFHIGQVSAKTPDRAEAVPEVRDWDKLDGSAWRMRAYETGALYFEPKEYQEAFDKPPLPVSVPNWMRGFSSRLVGVVKN